MIVPYLKSIYSRIDDTAELQHAVLNALLAQGTKESFVAFKDLMLQEPPISEEGDADVPVRVADEVAVEVVAVRLREPRPGENPAHDLAQLTHSPLPARRARRDWDSMERRIVAIGGRPELLREEAARLELPQKEAARPSADIR